MARAGSEPSRPQDAGRRHVRKGAPSTATATLLADVQELMRDECRRLVAELRELTAPGLGLTAPTPKIAELSQRDARYALLIKLTRELGTEVDPAPPPGMAPAATGAGRPRRGRIDVG